MTTFFDLMRNIVNALNAAIVDVDNTKEQMKTIKEEILDEIKELPVETTDVVEADNTLPITSAGVYNTVGNIEVLLKTI